MLLKLYLIISGGIFFIVGLIHFFRLIYHLQVIVGSTVIPLELSYLGLPVTLIYSSWAGWLLFHQKNKN